MLIYVYEADVSALIQLYIIGVFVSFTLSQLGMIRHWNRHLRDERDPAERAADAAQPHRSTRSGFCMTGTVLVIVLITKFTHGAWIVCIAMPMLFLIMKAIRRHYDRVSVELAAGEDETRDAAQPGARDRAGLQAAQADAARAGLRPGHPAGRCWRRSRSTSTTTTTARLIARVGAPRDPGPLKVLDSPYREITRPVVEYVRAAAPQTPRATSSCVYVPEYVVGHWWEQLLHNQSALRLKSRLLFQPGVMVVSVPVAAARPASGSERTTPAPERRRPARTRRGRLRARPPRTARVAPPRPKS